MDGTTIVGDANGCDCMTTGRRGISLGGIMGWLRGPDCTGSVMEIRPFAEQSPWNKINL